MDSAESHRKICLKQQTELRRLMTSSSQHQQALRLFLHQHALLHSQKMTPTEPWSFEDEVLDDLTDAQIRQVPPGSEHSVAWLIWHIARCEDITMNLLVEGTSQVLHQDGWLERVKSPIRHTGNAMDVPAIDAFSRKIDLDALRAYRLAVGCRTREIVITLNPEDMKQKVEPSRMVKVMEEGAVIEAAHGIADYWSKRDVAGLLLMPATRHPLIHLNEALELKREFAKSAAVESP